MIIYIEWIPDIFIVLDYENFILILQIHSWYIYTIEETPIFLLKWDIFTNPSVIVQELEKKYGYWDLDLVLREYMDCEHPIGPTWMLWGSIGVYEGFEMALIISHTNIIIIALNTLCIFGVALLWFILHICIFFSLYTYLIVYLLYLELLVEIVCATIMDILSR